jgi:anaerobic selenocysteine-containing dehydrogenase
MIVPSATLKKARNITTPALYAINKGKKMELNRRNFIKFVVGGMGGTLLSPLPWKLIDDISIWTQNWSIVPIPARGKISYVNTVCTLCSGACGIKVKKVGERIVKIEGKTEYPVNRGGICPLGMAGQQILYNEGTRWKAPMKRLGPRGSNKWEEVSWDEAIDTLDGNQSRSTIALLVKRLLDAVGSPNYLVMSGQEETYDMVGLLMQGSNAPLGFDLENSDFILSFGCSLLDGWGAPGRMLNAWGEWMETIPQGRTYVVQIDPSTSKTASMAHLWLAPFPGTEAALALGIAHVLIKEGLYDEEFIGNHTFGFTDWLEKNGTTHKGFSTIVQEKYSPQKVESITGIKQEVIMQVARKFARAKAPIALAGKGKGSLPGSLYEFMAVHALNALRGMINKKGGILLGDNIPLTPWPDLEYDSVAIEGLKQEKVDHAGSPRYPFAKSLIHAFSETIKGSPSSPIDTLLIFSSNPIYTVPDNQSLIEAMEKIPFIVSFSPFKDETSLKADLILPDHTHLEKMIDIVWPNGIQYPLYALSKPVIKPLYKTRHSGDAILSVAKKIGHTVAGSFQWTNFEEALQERVKGLYDSGKGEISSKGSEPIWKRLDKNESLKQAHSSFQSFWKDIKEHGCWYIPYHSYGEWSEIFPTQSKKFELFSTHIERAVEAYSRGKSLNDALNRLGIRALEDEVYMPHYEEAQSRADIKEYPLLLFPIELINLSSGRIGNPPFLNKTLFDHQLKGDDLFVEMNPKTASSYGLGEGSEVMLKSPRGELKVRIHLFNGAMPDVVFIPVGLGHTAYDRYLKGKGVNPYTIIERVEDPLSGQPVWWNTRVKVIKL